MIRKKCKKIFKIYKKYDKIIDRKGLVTRSSLRVTKVKGNSMADHYGVVWAYRQALEAYQDTNDGSASISKWAQWQLPLATDQKQVTEQRMEQLQGVLTIPPTNDGSTKNYYWWDFQNMGITDPYLLYLLVPDFAQGTPLGDSGSIHTLYSSVAGIVTTSGNSADQTFSQNSQSAMGAATQSTSALSTLGGMLQAFVQAMNASVIKI
jgi:hypothetical protein